MSEAGRKSLSPGVAHHDQLAAHWTTNYANLGFRRRLTLFLTVLARRVGRDEDWLDLGCGSGVLTRELLDRGARVVAVDASPSMLQQARAGNGDIREYPPVWMQGDAQHLPGLSDASFDGVLCSSVVEYVERPASLLREAARLLRPRGKLIISVPATGAAVRLVQKFLRRIARLANQDLFPYLQVSRFDVKPARLEQWLAEAGFVIDGVTKFDPLLPAIALSVLRPALLVVEAHKIGGA